MDPDGASLGSQTQAFGVQSKHSQGMGRVRDRRPRCFGVLSPRALLGLSWGQFELCVLPRPRFLTTGGAEFCRLPRSLGLE